MSYKFSRGEAADMLRLIGQELSKQISLIPKHTEVRVQDLGFSLGQMAVSMMALKTESAEEELQAITEFTDGMFDGVDSATRFEKDVDEVVAVQPEEERVLH